MGDQGDVVEDVVCAIFLSILVGIFGLYGLRPYLNLQAGHINQNSWRLLRKNHVEISSSCYDWHL